MRKSLLCLLAVVAMVLPFQNCGEPSHMDSSFLASLGDLTGCDAPLKRLFATTYYQVALNQCTGCHATGPSVWRFANSNFDRAFAGFSGLGHVRWERNAVNAGHNAAGGPHNQGIVNQNSGDFAAAEDAYNLCINPGGATATNTIGKANALILARAQQANINNRFALLSFDLDVDIAQANPLLPPVITFPATFTIEVAVAHPAGNLAVNSGYEFRNPTVTLKATAPVGSVLHVKGIRVLVNGVLLTDLTSYSLLMADVTGTVPVNLALGYAFGLGIYSPVEATDLISLQFDELSLQ